MSTRAARIVGLAGVLAVIGVAYALAKAGLLGGWVVYATGAIAVLSVLLRCVGWIRRREPKPR